MRPWLFAAFALALILPWGARAATDVYQIDPAASHVTVSVGKAGAFSFIAGHTHEVTGPMSGTAEIDLADPMRSQIHLVIDAAALKVSGANEPPADRPKVQATMDSEKVLDIARYPKITFDSTGVTIKRHDSTVVDADVAGQLTIRDVMRPVSVPVHVELSPGALTAQGHLSVKQTAFGITPVSVAGVVTVKDTLDISFAVSARR